MNQEDIFKLLLIVLLLANREINRVNNKNSDDDDDNDTAFSYSTLNDVLILVMLLNGFSADGSSTDQTNVNTTF